MSVSLNNVSQVNNTQSIKQPEKTTDEKPKFSTPTKTTVAIGAGLTALAAIGIYFATRGRGAKATEKVVAETVKGATQTAQESANTVKENTVEAFKKAGNKFEKGKAIKADGTGFSGTILNKTKDGAEVSLVYENGLIQKSTKTKNGEKLFEKTYRRTIEGSDRISFVNIHSKGTRIYSEYDPDDGTLLREIRREDGTISNLYKDFKRDKVLIENHKNFIYDKSGNLFGERDRARNITIYYPNGKMKFKQESGTLKYFDEKGNMTHQFDFTEEGTLLTTPKGIKFNKGTNKNMQEQQILDSYNTVKREITDLLSNGKHYMD